MPRAHSVVVKRKRTTIARPSRSGASGRFTSSVTPGEVLDAAVVGSVLAWARRSRGLSQSAVAQKLDISKSYLSLLEGGKRTLAFAKLIEFAYQLDLDPVELIERILENSPRRGRRYVPAIAEAVRGI